MTKKEIVEKIRVNIELQIALDDMVRDRFEMLASEVNNSGVEAQLRWLERTCNKDAEEVFKLVSDNSN